MPAESLDQVVSLAKRRGFIYPGSAIYGGLANSWDYGPLGIELKNNVKQAWWKANVRQRDDMEGLDAALIMNRKVWKYSGHEATFNDPMQTCKFCKKHFRVDKIPEKMRESAWIQSLLVFLEHEKLPQASLLADGGWLRSVLGRSALGIDYVKWAKTKGQQLAPGLALVRNPSVTISWLAERIEAKGEDISLDELLCYLATEQLKETGLVNPCPECGGELTKPRPFNLMFESNAGAVASEDNKVYLRPETAQGIFVNFKHVLDTMRRRLPFGIAQMGKSFRNEITPGNFTFRTREFEQMEIEYFVLPGRDAGAQKDRDELAHEDWVNTRYRWYLDLGLPENRLRKRAQDKQELAHYAKACTDIEYEFPGASMGFSEIEGVANRTDFDLTAHSREVPNDAEARARLKLPPNPDSVENLTYFDADYVDPVTGKKGRHVVPYVIEPSAGVDRTVLAFLCEAYNEELVGEVPEADRKAVSDALDAFLKSVGKNEDMTTDQQKAILAAGEAIKAAGPQGYGRISAMLEMPGADKVVLGKKLKGQADRVVEANFRVVLKLDPRLAPIKVAVFPLKKNNADLVERATRITRMLKHHWNVTYDDTGAIGKLYRRQDEIGTPFCVTVDFQTLEDNTVTLRERDTMEQKRLKLDDGELLRYLMAKIDRHAMPA